MDRREAIKRMAVLSGGALSLSTIAGIMGGCSSESSSTYKLQTLSDDQNELVTVISEHIIPETDTPGAKGAKVNQFIDKMMTDWYASDERSHFLSGLDHVDEISNKSTNNDFLDLSDEAQIKVLKQLEQEGKEHPASEANIKPIFPMMKELTIVGYFTSEIGASKELNTDIIPGVYQGCMPYADVGSEWSNAGT